MFKKDKKHYGLIASFKNITEVCTAAEKIRDAGFKRWDLYSPLPIHNIHEIMGLKRSKVSVITLFGGITGFLTGMAIVYYMNAYDYPLIVGGKPFFSPIFPFPVFYELTILFASFGAFFGMFLTNLLPRHNHPVFNHEPFLKASDDGFFITIESRDPLFDFTETQTLLTQLGGTEITLLDR